MAAYLHFVVSVPNLSLAIDTQYPNLSAGITQEAGLVRHQAAY